jgi:hypothetical protein
VNRTHPTPLIGLGVAGIVAGYLIQLGIVASGDPMLLPPLSLPITLLAIGVIVVLLALPIRRAVRGTSKARIDPFRAMRTAVLAKACSLSGALLAGAGVGLLLFVLTRTVLPGLDPVWLTSAAAAGGVLLMVGGLIAEFFCMLPPPEDDEHETDTPPVA